MGTSDDGTATLSIEGSGLFGCLIILSDATYGWTKPAQVANWPAGELAVTVNGQACEAPTCTFGGGGLVIDAADALGASACRRQKIRVGLRVTPLDFSAPRVQQGVCGADDHAKRSEPVPWTPQGRDRACRLGKAWGKYEAFEPHCRRPSANATCRLDPDGAARARGARLITMPDILLTF